MSRYGEKVDLSVNRVTVHGVLPLQRYALLDAVEAYGVIRVRMRVVTRVILVSPVLGAAIFLWVKNYDCKTDHRNLASDIRRTDHRSKLDARYMLA